MTRRPGASLLLGSLEVTVTAGPPNELVAVRFDQLELRDPHIFIPVSAGCTDATDSLNLEIQKEISGDGEFTDGLLGLNSVLVFASLDPTAATTSAQYLAGAECAVPASATVCRAGNDPATTLTLTNQPSGNCLGVIDGTASGYMPPIGATTGNCFASAPQAIPLRLLGTPVQLLDAQLAAVYNGTRLESGLLRGFLRQTDAVAATIKLGSGSVTLASLLPGGPLCGPDGRDMLNGEIGWWFYFNFTATKVWFAP